MRTPSNGDNVAYHSGGRIVAGTISRVWGPACVNVDIEGGGTMPSVPFVGDDCDKPADDSQPWCEFIETEGLGFDPVAAIAPNPIESIREWAAAVTTTPTMAEALCMEEQAEAMQEFVVTDGIDVDNNQANFAAALRDYSRVLREHPELAVRYVDKNKAVDAHLDSAWVHLLAVATLIGSDGLAEAWARLHKANIDGKKVDGVFVVDSTGKVTKPEGWTAPDYTDLVKEN